MLKADETWNANSSAVLQNSQGSFFTLFKKFIPERLGEHQASRPQNRDICPRISNAIGRVLAANLIKPCLYLHLYKIIAINKERIWQSVHCNRSGSNISRRQNWQQILAQPQPPQGAAGPAIFVFSSFQIHPFKFSCCYSYTYRNNHAIEQTKNSGNRHCNLSIVQQISDIGGN